MAAGEPRDRVLADLIALGGAGMAVHDFDHEDLADLPGEFGVIRVGVDRTGATPEVFFEAYDVLLTTAPDAPAPWVSTPDVDQSVAQLQAQAEQQTVAASVAAQVLRMTLHLGFREALGLESMAYSMLLGAEGFRAWRAATPARTRPEAPAPRVLIAEQGGSIAVTLDRPARRNAFDAAMRDELTEALHFALFHPDKPQVVLSGAGPAFSAGGDLDEFGSARDVGRAHLIRTLRSPASLAYALEARLTVRLHGACVGAGIEVPAAAARVVAARGTFFRLPEVSMGLIPGAGGTASIPRRIGRHRAAWMAVSGADIDLPTALAWGLVDAEDAAR
jgi:hypothetical protein